MLYLVLFWHGGDSRPAVRVIRGDRVEADCSRDRIAALYDDPAARVVEIADDHDDYDQVLADYEAMLDADEAITAHRIEDRAARAAFAADTLSEA